MHILRKALSYEGWLIASRVLSADRAITSRSSGCDRGAFNRASSRGQRGLPPFTLPVMLGR